MDTVLASSRVPMVHVYVQHYLKNNLKYKHSGATGTQVGVVPFVQVVFEDDLELLATSRATMVAS